MNASFEFFFGLTELVLHGFLGSDIADGTEHDHTRVRGERTQADFDGEFAAIFAQAVELAACAHGADARRIGVVVAMVDVSTAIAVGKEPFNRLAEKFVARVAKNRFGLRVDENDCALLIRR